ncbi:MAG: HAD-IB family hydrolase [Rhodoluna sp.]|nr:HAD-IB family hydrolase [Rhodoluna sp.]
MPKTPQPAKIEAAFFDLDNTLLRGASAFLFAKAAFERKFVNRRELWRFAWQQFKFITRGESAKMLAHIEDRAMSLVVGQSAAALEALVGITWEEYVKAKMWPETVRIAQEHVKNGREVWIVTASPVQMGEYIAKELGLTGALGTILEVKDGLLTGEFEGRPLHGKAKAKAIKKLAAERGISLKRSYAYSDSHNDLYMLTKVGHPVAVNPDKTLLRFAKAARWKILDFKKRELKANK